MHEREHQNLSETTVSEDVNQAAPADAGSRLTAGGNLGDDGRHKEEVARLRELSKQGDLAATTTLAARLLVGRDAPTAPEEGVALLRAAHDAGDAQAANLLATLAGAGAWTEQSWPQSLDLLRQAAERGSHDAGLQLTLLATDEQLVARARRNPEPDDWKRLRDNIDLEKWIVPPPAVSVCQNPRIWTAENVVKPEFCNWMVSRSLGKFKRALMFNGQKAILAANRTNSDFVFDIVESGVCMLLLRIRVSRLVQLPIPYMEPPQIFHYATGEEIGNHYDFLFDGEHGYGRTGNYTGDRLATYLMWLNDGYEGGDLVFPKADFRHRGKKGDGNFFARQRDGKPDKMSLHAALPVTKGEKYILSQWIHDRAFEA